MSELGPVPLYESLARFQWWRRKLAHAAPGQGLEMRKRLHPAPAGGPTDGAAGLDVWLMQQLGEQPRHRLLDLGCGFGISMLRWLPAQASPDGGNAHAFGITPSSYQVRRARMVAAELGAAQRCTFLQQSMAAELPEDLDVVLAIESLGHTSDLSLVLRHIRQSLRPGGWLVWLEDLLREPMATDADVVALAKHWSSPPMRDVADVRMQLQAAGMQVHAEVDLTSQVPHRSLAQIERSHRAACRWRRYLPVPFARRIAQAFTGGFVLERLYARELACYRLLLARPCEVPR